MRVTTRGSPPAFSISSSSHASMSPPDLKTRGASPIAPTSLGRGSYSCGSAFVPRMPCTSTRSPPTFLTKSATWVVVATTVSSAPLAWESLSPQPVATAAEAVANSSNSGSDRGSNRRASQRESLIMILIHTASYRSVKIPRTPRRTCRSRVSTSDASLAHPAPGAEGRRDAHAGAARGRAAQGARAREWDRRCDHRDSGRALPTSPRLRAGPRCHAAPPRGPAPRSDRPALEGAAPPAAGAPCAPPGALGTVGPAARRGRPPARFDQQGGGPRRPGAGAPVSAPFFGEVQLAFLHHTVTANDYSIDESASIVRGMQHYHRNVLGWNDIGYNLLVDRYGQVFEGRAGGIDQAVVGAQAQGYNTVSAGIAVIGTHTSQGITSAAFEALASVVAWKLLLHGLSTDGEVTVTSTGGSLNRYPAGTPVRLLRISGHRDGDATECPGEALFGQLPALRARAGQLAGRLAFTSGLALSVSPRRVDYLGPATVSGRLLLPDGTPGAGMPVEVQARSAGGWGRVASAVTDPAGAWSTTLALPYTRALRAVATDAAGSPLTSRSTRLEVRSAVTPRIRPVRLNLGRGTILSGRVEPVKRRQRLVATIERRLAAGRYVRVARLPVTAGSGRFRLPLRPSRPGLYRIRLSVAGDRLNAHGRSGF